MGTDGTPHALGKVGRREHMYSLYTKGIVYMSRISAFAKMEGNVRGDRNEGLFAYFSGSNSTLKVTVKTDTMSMELPIVSSSIQGAIRDHAAYCMYAVPLTEDLRVVESALRPLAHDSRIREFGDLLVLITDTEEFARRLVKAAKVAGYGLAGRLVDYVSQDYCGDMGPFRKLDNYKYQSEWRAVTRAPIPDKPLILELGSLTDIAMPIDLRTASG